MTVAERYTVHADALTLAMAARSPEQVEAARDLASSILNIGESSCKARTFPDVLPDVQEWTGTKVPFPWLPPPPAGLEANEAYPPFGRVTPVAGRPRRWLRDEWAAWWRIQELPGCWGCGEEDGHDAGCPADRDARDRVPPRPPPFCGRGPDVPGTWYAPEHDDPETGKAWKACDALGPMAYVEGGRQAYALAASELDRQGRPRKAARVRKCCKDARIVPYYCAGCVEDHHRLQGACGLKVCPGCTERQYRKTRNRIWKAFGRVTWGHTWTITCPPELRDQHTPEQFTAWAARVAAGLDRWALEAFGVRLAYCLSAHWTGEKRAADGVFAPHLNLILSGRCLPVATDRDDYGRPRIAHALDDADDLDHATGGYFHIRAGKGRHGNDVWYGMSETDRLAFRDALCSWAFPGLAPDRYNAHLEVKPNAAAFAHAVRYNIRPAGDGRPDLLARWTWDGCRDVRVGGCLASRWSVRWLHANPPDARTTAQQMTAVAPGTLSYIVCAEGATEEVGPEFCRALEGHRLDGSGSFFPDRELSAAVHSGDPERIERVVRDIHMGIPPTSDEQVHDPPPTEATFDIWRRRLQADAIEKARKGWDEFYEAERSADYREDDE